MLELLRTRHSPAFESFNGAVLSFDAVRSEVAIAFEAHAGMCHSEVIVQGGYVTGMLDSAMFYAGLGALADVSVLLPTLEIKVSFLEIANPGRLVASARPVRMGRSVGFLEAELRQADALVATATSTVRILRPRAA